MICETDPMCALIYSQVEIDLFPGEGNNILAGTSQTTRIKAKKDFKIQSVERNTDRKVEFFQNSQLPTSKHPSAEGVFSPAVPGIR